MKFLIELLAYTPAIIKAIMDVEGVVTAPKSGATKKQLVMASLDVIAKDGEQVDKKLVQLISSLVDSIVTSLNASKMFTPSA
jgi:hypothetical protein